MYNVIKTINIYKNVFIITIFIMLFGTNLSLKKKNDALKSNIEITLSNVTSYENLLNEQYEKGNTLQLKIEDLEKSKDKVIIEMNKTIDSLKVRKSLTHASSVTQKIDTTLTTTIERKDTLPDNYRNACDFTKVLQPNDLTKIEVKSVADSLQVTIKLLNEQLLFIYRKKVYVNPDKKLFARIVTFDWRKRKESRYEIINTNDLIDVTNTRIIEIEEK